MSTTSTGLTKVQNLYLLQMELWKVLDGRVRSRESMKDAQRKLKEFSSLLREVDWRYMGGEDVYQGLNDMLKEADQKLKAKLTK